MNDRLGDLMDSTSPSWAANDVESGPQSPSANDDYTREVELEEVDSSARPPEHMETFFRHVDSIKANIKAISAATKRIGKLNEAAMLATSDAKEAEVSGELRPLVNETNKTAKRTKDLLALMKEGNEKVKKNEKVKEKVAKRRSKVKQSDVQIRENLCNTLARKFVDETRLYQRAQEKYKADIQRKAKRQVQIVKPDVTDAELDAVMRSEGGREGLFRTAILTDGVADSVKAAYSEVAGKYEDVLALEQSVAQLNQMFLDLALLTEQQGELCDHIELQVKNAAETTEDANDEVYKAIRIQKKIRRKHCFIILIVVVVIVIVVVLPLL